MKRHDRATALFASSSLTRRKKQLLGFAVYRIVLPHLKIHEYEVSSDEADFENMLNEGEEGVDRFRYATRCCLARLEDADLELSPEEAEEGDRLLRGLEALAEDVVCPDVSLGPVPPDALPIALAAYAERLSDPVRLAVLADCLEEAGSEPKAVAHLRTPGPHVRGCWAVDLVLGRQ